MGSVPPPLKFTFNCIDEPNCPQLRAARVLADFVSDDRDDHKINDILCMNGHFVVVFNNRQSLCVQTRYTLY